jgi:preprotein translocase subunit YajC
MTSQGIYGTLLSIDNDKNEAIIETTPGVKLRVHSQTIEKAVDDVPVADEAAAETPRMQLNESSAAPMTEPEFGERADKPKPAPRTRKKPTE